MSQPEARFCIRCGTPLTTKVVFGAEHPACPACDWIYFQDPKVAVGVLVEREGKVLLVKRINEPQSGAWSIPAGFMDAFEDPGEAARRECREETGLEIEIGPLAAVVGGREHPKGADLVICYHARVVGGELRAGDDAGEVGFFARDQLPVLAFRATRTVLDLN